MVKVTHINYIEFPASDLNVTQAFYEAIFAWHFTNYGNDYRAFNDGQLDGGFYRSELSSRTQNGAALVILKSNNLKSIRDKVIAAGGTITREIFSFPGGKRFQFADPNGNELAVWSDG